MSDIQVRQSIVSSSVLPTEHKQIEVKKEIIASTTEGKGAGAGFGAGTGYEIYIYSSVIVICVHQINQGITLRQYIIRRSVLPTIEVGQQY